MAEHTSIEWTDATWNPITGCSVLSPGCTNCYAMKLAGTRLRNHPSRKGLTTRSKAGPVWNGQVRFNEIWLTQPLSWKRAARIFVCAHGDLFHEAVPDAWIDKVFAVMAMAPRHSFQVLTKRAARMRAYLSAPRRPHAIARAAIDLMIEGRLPKEALAEEAWPVASIGDVEDPDDVTLRHWPLPNGWLGVSAEDQPRADERIPDLLITPAAIRFVSAEPLIGGIHARPWLSPAHLPGRHRRIGSTHPNEWIADEDGGHLVWHGIDWVIAGGESGPGARPMHPDWARALRDQCQAAGVPFFFKQWGEWGPFGSMSGPQTAVANDGTTYALGDLAYPDGPRRREALAAGHDKADLTIMYRAGKKSAGRLLDGVEWNGLPEAGR